MKKNVLLLLTIFCLLIQGNTAFAIEKHNSNVVEIALQEHLAQPDEYSSYCICYENSISTLEELKKESPIIVKARILENSKNYANSYGEWGYTSTPVKILEIYKNDKEDAIITVDDIIDIEEPYYFRFLENGEIWKYDDSQYAASEIGKEYIFFLDYISYDEKEDNAIIPQELYAPFSVVRGILGRYPVINYNARSISFINTMQEKDFSLEDGASLYVLKPIFEEIYKEYQ